MTRHSVLFVCTGNVFRSLAAELALKSVLPPGSGIEVSSAGTHAQPDKPVRDDVRERLEHWGAGPSGHTPRLLTQEIIDQADLVIAMSSDHQAFIEREFGRRAYLYMDIAAGRSLPFPDLPDVVSRHREKPEESRAFVNGAIDKIFGFRKAFMRRLFALLPDGPAEPARQPEPGP